MFPLHEDTIALLAIFAVGAWMAVFVAYQKEVRTWVAGIILLGLIWPWPIAFYLGLDGYTMAVAFYLSIWTTLALAIGAAWGLVARRLRARIAVSVVAIVPSLFGTVYLLEHQRVPDEPCNERAVFQIGDLSLAVPRDLGIRSFVASGAPNQAWEGTYSHWPGAKPDVRALCRATNGGREVLQVTHLWFSFSGFRRDHKADCESGEVAGPLRAYCTAIERTELTVVQFYARPDGMPFPSLSHFNVDSIAGAVSAGESEGYQCNEATDGTSTRYCTIWQNLTGDVLAVSSATLSTVSDYEDPVADTATALEAFTRSLRPE
jgi:hypothetical protein